ncbi:hypothetical protein Pcac1_g15961 [Phytophthora cactorum]|nr:hypothetical protein Pcac1_g15961 [Phytophthora cactorum]
MVQTNFSSASSLPTPHLGCPTPRVRPTAKNLLRVQPNKRLGHLVATRQRPALQDRALRQC